MVNELAPIKPLAWIADQPTQEDLDHVLKEGSGASEFDPLLLRQTMVQDLRAGRARLITKSCAFAKVLAIVYPDQINRIPWGLFGRIFAAFGRGRTESWRIVWFANPTPRQLPLAPAPAGPAHLNGGYALPCQPRTVVLYRAEEAARVLIHELLHAACTDNMNDPVEVRETKTEVWAELFLISVLAGGSTRRAARLWNIQAQWIADQEAVLKGDHGVVESAEYAYRYTVGRREFLETLGIRLPAASQDPRAALGGSLRFTAPALLTS
jgi:hypothetical protein